MTFIHTATIVMAVGYILICLLERWWFRAKLAAFKQTYENAMATAATSEYDEPPIHFRSDCMTKPKTQAKIVIAHTKVEVMVIWADTAGGDVHLCASFPPGCVEAAAAVAQAYGLPVEEKKC